MGEDDIKKEGAACRYPIILVHGITLKDNAFFKSFGRIKKILKRAGHSVFTANIDGFGTIEGNAEQLKKCVEEIRDKSGAEKVNIIAHSKGGLDSRYMIENLGMDERVASLTTLCTPHRGSQIANRILRLPNFLTKFIAFWINLWYRIFGDKKPNALQVCKQLQAVPESDDAVLYVSPLVYCQSYSATMKKGSDDFIMGIPYVFSKHWEKKPTDGLVTPDSTVYGNYKGDCLDDSVSHLQILGYAAGKKKKEKIYAFYLQLCEELSQMGF